MKKSWFRVAFGLGVLFGGTSVFAEAPPKLPARPETGTRRLAEAEAPVGEAVLPWWTPEAHTYALGYEGTLGGSFNLFGHDAITFGMRLDPSWDLDTYFGYSKAADSYAEVTTTADNAVSNGRTTTTAYAGARAPHSFLVGLGLRYRVFQNSWFLLSAGGVVATTTPSHVSYRTGSLITQLASKDSPDNSVNTDTIGSVDRAQALQLAVGPKVNAEFFLRWFPHLGIGLSTGVLTSFGGKVTTTTTTRDRRTTVINGVEQPAGTDTTSVEVRDEFPGFRGKTFGLGGTTFSAIGVFTLRYVW